MVVLVVINPIGQIRLLARQQSVSESACRSRQTAITRAVQAVSPAVVGINVTQVKRLVRKSPFSSDPFFRGFFPDIPFEKRVKSLGSGVLISESGYILTNQHVVEDATEIVVTPTGSQKYKARVVGEDRKLDIAVLKIDGGPFPHARLGRSDDVIIGEWVIALGNPFGLFDISSTPTVTVGVISAKDQDFGRQGGGRVYEDMLQTDAAINSGNSGGPLVNCNGDVIGINTWILSGSHYSGTNIGIGFAIPINRVKTILDDLIHYGRVDRSFWTGITCADLRPSVARYLGLSSTRGCIVTDVTPKSPAAQAGIQVEDVIVALDDEPVKDLADVNRLVDELDLKAGDVVAFKIFRNGRILSRSVTLASNPDTTLQ